MKRIAPCLMALAVLLAACVPAERLRQEQVDQARLTAQRQEHDSNEKCSQIAMPGTPEHLACRLGAAQPAK